MIPWHYRQKKLKKSKSSEDAARPAPAASSPPQQQKPAIDPDSVAKELVKLTKLRGQNLITHEEFQAAKRKLLGL